MRSVAALLLTGLIAASCAPEGDVTGSTNKCATGLFPSYNPKAHDQCVDVCVKCNKGTLTTCSTSCTLKGAR
jgi:hypothetical protein